MLPRVYKIHVVECWEAAISLHTPSVTVNLIVMFTVAFSSGFIYYQGVVYQNEYAI